MSIVEDDRDEVQAAQGSRPFIEVVKLFYESEDAIALRPYIYWPDGSAGQRNSIEWALTLLRDSAVPPPGNYVPIMPVDDLSMACVEYEEGLVAHIPVRRWHLGAIDPKFQDALLDTDLAAYVRSVREELDYRPRGLNAIDRAARKYKAEYVSKGIRPRGNVLRPVQLACQNVVVGLATLRHDPTFDGLRVPVYLTCEVPHVATHEANRAMAALILCDAFQNGGTMEIRFGEQHTPLRIPSALARFARTVDVPLGDDNPECITPGEARKLFTAVTPIPDDLRLRLDNLVDRGVINPERACYVLMAGVWTAIEFDYILATSSRTESIMRGGAAFDMRPGRQAELETCRAAAMLGMLHRYLTNADYAAGTGVRVFEDQTRHVSWSINEERGVVVLATDRVFELPWRAGEQNKGDTATETLIGIPRGLPTESDFATARQLRGAHPDTVVALLVPADMASVVPTDIPTLVCPERLAEIDAGIERRLVALRVGRL